MLEGYINVALEVIISYLLQRRRKEAVVPRGAMLGPCRPATLHHTNASPGFIST